MADDTRRYRVVGDNHYHDGERLRRGDVCTLPVAIGERFASTFEPVEDDAETDTDDTESEAEDDAEADADVGAEADTDDTSTSPTCAGLDGECSRAVDEAGGYCYQHGPESEA